MQNVVPGRQIRERQFGKRIAQAALDGKISEVVRW
jgi:hypothetical protein